MPENTGANLTQIAYFGRQGVKFSAIALVVLIVGRVFLTAAVGYWVATHPAAPPPPTVGFGRIPGPHFPTKTQAEKPISYQLQTGKGDFPAFKDRAKVFLMVKSSPSLLADQRAKEIAANFGFLFQPNALNDRTYRWNKTTPLIATLDMDIQNYTFKMTTNYLSKPELLAQRKLPIERDAVELVKSFISTAQTIGPDIATTSGRVAYLKALGGDVSPAVSFSDADFLKVDLDRTPVDSLYPMFTPNGVDGIVHAVVSGSFQGKDGVMDIVSNYHQVDYTQVETYPLRAVNTAWQTLQAGEGYVAQKGTSDIAVVRNVVLGYYDDDQEQDYLQPVYVFTGDNGFIGYVSALDPTWINTGVTQTK